MDSETLAAQLKQVDITKTIPKRYPKTPPTLPPELYAKVCRFLPRRSVKCLSLANKLLSGVGRNRLWLLPRLKDRIQPQLLSQLRTMPIKALNIFDFELTSTADFETLAVQLSQLSTDSSSKVDLEMGGGDRGTDFFVAMDDLLLVADYVTVISSHALEYEHETCALQFAKFPKLKSLILCGYEKLSFSVLQSLSHLPITELRTSALQFRSAADVPTVTNLLRGVRTLRRVILDFYCSDAVFRDIKKHFHGLPVIDVHLTNSHRQNDDT